MERAPGFSLLFGSQALVFLSQVAVGIKILRMLFPALSISADSRRKLSATWEKISNRGRLLSCLAKCYYVGNLPNSTGLAGYFSIHGLLLLNLLKGLLSVFPSSLNSFASCKPFVKSLVLNDVLHSVGCLFVFALKVNPRPRAFTFWLLGTLAFTFLATIFNCRRAPR